MALCNMCNKDVSVLITLKKWGISEIVSNTVDIGFEGCKGTAVSAVYCRQ